MGPMVVAAGEELRSAVATARAQGLSVGFVPTMGALHAGHASLLREARQRDGFVVASIFVNPTQFGPNEDLSRYPRPFERDLQICEAERVDLVFHPPVEVLYPPDFHTFIEVHDFQNVLCGVTRPTHFRGVATVVLKLFNLVQPNAAYFGQKDAQQVRVLQQMVRDLDVPVRVVVCPIVREADGLAMSSRNQYLTPTQRASATVLSQALVAVRQRIEAGERNAEALVELARSMIEPTPEARIDYVAIVDFATLRPIARLQGQVLVALAVFVGTTRLIDNLLLQADTTMG
jgi:pantoate--beta-alanine ligase